MNNELWISALILGALGSWHCAAMCGPLVLVACGDRPNNTQKFLNYLGTRLLSYTLVGACLGLFGNLVIHRLSERVLHFGVAFLIAGYALWRGFVLWRANSAQSDVLPLPRPSPPPTFVSMFRTALAWVRNDGRLLGLASAFLPCGLFVPAWMMAASSHSLARGSLTMAAFAVGSAVGPTTIWLGQRFLAKHWRLPTQGMPFVWATIAVLAILRPYLTSGHHCH